MRLVVRLAIILLLIGVGWALRYNRAHRPGATAVSPGGVPMVFAKENDPRLAAASAEAKRRWPEFVAAYQNPGSRDRFGVKHAFPIKDGGAEFMWVKVTSIQGNQVSGTLDDQPYAHIGLREGDPVALTVPEVDDWVYFEGAAMVGGFSEAALRAIESERRQK